jgi:hypothetical protein
MALSYKNFYTSDATSVAYSVQKSKPPQHALLQQLNAIKLVPWHKSNAQFNARQVITVITKARQLYFPIAKEGNANIINWARMKLFEINSWLEKCPTSGIIWFGGHDSYGKFVSKAMRTLNMACTYGVDWWIDQIHVFAGVGAYVGKIRKNNESAWGIITPGIRDQ